MTTIPLELPAAAAAPAALREQPDEQRAQASPEVRSRLRRAPAVLAPTLPALVLLGLCIAGLQDPPDVSSGSHGTASRLHVPTADPSALPSVPLHRRRP